MPTTKLKYSFSKKALQSAIYFFIFKSVEFDTDSATGFETFACLFVNAKCFQQYI